MINILIVEDEKPISRLIEISLTENGYHCDTAFDGEIAIEKIDQNVYDLILLDIMIPKIDGWEVMNYINQIKIPTIMITANSTVLDKVSGLKSGADDYITKPFDIAELLARIESLLRRLGKLEMLLEFDDVKIDLMTHVVTKNNKEITLTNKEYELLLLLIQNKNIILVRDVIYQRIWGLDYEYDSRTLDLHISRLRQKLSLKEKIVTIKKVGYRFVL